MLVLPLTLALAAAVSPLGVEVHTRDGHQRFVPVPDADLTPTEVCLADGSVCAPVAAEHGRLVARVDADAAAGFVVRGVRVETRSQAPAAIALGLGVAAVGASAGALTASAISAGAAGSHTDTAAVASTMSLAMWVGAGVAATGAAVVGVIAVGDAMVVDEGG